MKIKKLFNVLLALVVVTTLFVGCGKSEVDNNGEVEDLGQSKKHVKIFTNLSEANVTYAVWDDILNAYQEEVNPNFTWEIEVVPNHDQYLDKLKLYIGGGNMPDIYQIPNGPMSVQLAEGGKMVDIGAELEAMGMYDTYNKACLEFLKFDDDSLYLFPDGRYAELFWYWKDDFNKYGLEAPNTFNEFLDTCEVLKENGESPITMGGKESWQALRYVSFIPWVTTTDEFINTLKTGQQKYVDSEIGMDGADFLYELAEKKYFINGYENLGYAENLNTFFNKKAVISYFGPNDLTPELIELYKEGKLGYFQVPYVDGKEDGAVNIPVHTGKAWGIDKDAYDEEVQRFFEYFVRNHTKYSHEHSVFSPLDEGIPEDMEPILKDIYGLLQKVEKPWVSWDDKLDPSTIVKSGELATELSQGLISPDDYAAEFDKSIEENAAEYFGK